HRKKLHASILSHSAPQPREFNVMKHRNVIAYGMFKIDPSQTSRENVSSDMVTASSTGLVHTAKTRRPQRKGNSRNARVLSASKRSEVKKNVVQICLWCVNSGCSKHMTGNIKLLVNFVWKFLGTVCFRNDHIDAILGYGDLKWGNITITRVYYVEGLGQNLFLVGQFCDADLKVAFRRNTRFIRDLDGVDLLKGNRSTNLYTINLYDMASTSPICLMARATPTKSWLWHQRLSHLNFDTINELDKNDLIFGLPKFKYAKEHLCPSCELGKSKKASHPPKPVSNSKHRLHLLHMDLCDPIVYNHRTNKVMETMNVTFDELLVTTFEQNSSRPDLQSMTSRQISSKLELSYDPLTITPQRPSEHDMDILFEPLHNEYLGGRH
nr:retrovirus-related Pol polyprotein from transposon TNT 1-94 [Tanacetum cinerariifolium]